MPHDSILGFPNQVIENEMDMSHGSLTNGSQISFCKSHTGFVIANLKLFPDRKSGGESIFEFSLLISLKCLLPS